MGHEADATSRTFGRGRQTGAIGCDAPVADVAAVGDNLRPTPLHGDIARLGLVVLQELVLTLFPPSPSATTHSVNLKWGDPTRLAEVPTEIAAGVNAGDLVPRVPIPRNEYARCSRDRLWPSRAWNPRPHHD